MNTMARWLIFSLLAAFMWGVWAIFFKLGARHMSSLGAKLWETVGFALVILPLFIYMEFSVVWSGLGFTYSILGGITGGLGNYFFFNAFSKGGKASVVTALIATSPVLTISCAYVLLHERISLLEATGCLCAIIAAVLITD